MLKNWRVIFGKPKQVRIRPWFSWLIAGGISIALIMWLSDWGTQVSRDWVTLQQNPTDATKKKFDASLEVVKAIVSGVGTVATIGGGFFVFWNVRLTQTRLVTERFSKAVEQLGSDKIEVRLGGIYALERIAQDSDRDHWTIMEVLTSFIQGKTSIKRFSEEKIRVKAYERWQQSEKGMSDKQNWDSAIRELAAELMTKDIQAALTVIGRRRYKKDPPDKELNLSYIHLSFADLHRAFLHRADFYAADFYAAVLTNADLTNANLRGADLTNADLTNANLRGADLEDADLRGTDISGTNLSFADLKNVDLRSVTIWNTGRIRSADTKGLDLRGVTVRIDTDLSGTETRTFIISDDTRGDGIMIDPVLGTETRTVFSSADLRGADLRGVTMTNTVFSSADLSFADLRNTDLSNSDLGGAFLYDTDLRGANLSRVQGITTDQIKQAQNWQEAQYSLDFRQKLGLSPKKP